MPPVTSVTIVFDNNVTKVEIYTDSNRTQLESTITTSGSSYNITSQTTYYSKVYMSDGYIIDNVVSSYVTAIPTGDIIRNITNDTFDFVETQTGDTITITSKKSTSQVSIDLTTLSGWGNVADGEHVIQVVAKADGYRDSEKSTGVSFTKSVSVTLPAGTYRFNETPTSTETIGAEISGKMYSLTDDNTYGALVEFNQISAASGNYLAIENIDAENLLIDYDNVYWQFHNANEVYTATDTTKLRTITIETDQQVSQEFKTWFDNNTSSVASGHTLNITNSSSSTRALQVYTSKSGFQGELLTTIAKGSTSEVNIPTDYVYFTYDGTYEELFTLSNVSPSNSIVQDSGGLDYLACKINQNGSCTITIG